MEKENKCEFKKKEKEKRKLGYLRKLHTELGSAKFAGEQY